MVGTHDLPNQRQSYMKFQLPKPPSVNHIYGLTAQSGHARSYIVAEGITWFKNACVVYEKAFTQETISTPVTVYIKLYHRRRQDLDNINKPLLDSLHKWCIKCQTRIVRRLGCKCKQNYTVIVDDDQMHELHEKKFKIDKNQEEYVELEIIGYKI